MKNYIDRFHKESEIRAACPEQSTPHFENVDNITVDSDSVIPQEKKTGSEKYQQANYYEENESNKSTEEIVSKKVEQNKSH